MWYSSNKTLQGEVLFKNPLLGGIIIPKHCKYVNAVNKSVMCLRKC